MYWRTSIFIWIMMALHSKMDYKEKLTIKRLASKDELGVVKERHELGGEVGCCFDV